ncbi:hypothetical protein R3I93_006657 [Phoxinus phoxinus]
MARSVVWSRGRLLDPETANDMLDQVSEFLDQLETLTQQHVPQGYSAPLVRGSSGRPRFCITEEQLRFLLEYNFSTKQMAEILCVSRRTVKRRLRWRIVIHGGIDGYSRLVVFLKASSNNRSDTVFHSFVEAIGQYGLPSRVRCDNGGENNAVCLFMNVFRGFTRGSALRGRSTHNQRIERLWRDVWRGISNTYYALFMLLESEGKIYSTNEMHLWALHYVYIPRINRDLQLFIRQWNHHKLRTERYMSPHQLFIRGCLSQLTRNQTGIRGILGADEEPVADVYIPPASEEVPPQDFQTIFNWPESVEIPANHFNIQGGVMEQLVQQVNPLGGRRDDLGTDLLEQVINFLGNIPQPI